MEKIFYYIISILLVAVASPVSFAYAVGLCVVTFEKEGDEDAMGEYTKHFWETVCKVGDRVKSLF